MKRVIGNLVWTTASKVVDAGVRFLTVPIILHYFGKVEFGLLALAFSVNVFLTLADFGLNVNAVRKLSDYLIHHDWPSLGKLVHACSFYYSVVGLINLVGVLFVGYMSASWFNLAPEQARVFMWMMASLGLGSWLGWSFMIHRQIIQAAGQLGWDERNSLVCTVGAIVLVGLTLYLRLDLPTYFFWSLVIGSIPIALRIWKVKRLVPGLTIRFRADWITFRPIVGTSLMIFAMTLAQMMANNFRPIILASRGSLEDVADYRIIQGVVSFALLVSGGVLNVVYPEVARLEAQGDAKRLRDFTYRGTSLLLWGHVLLVIPLALCAGSILQLYVGASYTHLALPLGLWLLTCAAGHNAIFSSVLLSRGKLGALTISSIFNSVLTLALAYVLVPHYGLNAAVWTYVLFVVLQALYGYVFLLPKLGMGSLSELLTIVFGPLFGAAVAAGLSVALILLLGLPLWCAGFLAAAAIIGISVRFGNVMGNLRFLSLARSH